MSLSSLQLDAFVAVARTRSFSRAAKTLHLTQSALSQRVKNLEGELRLTLFLREKSGVQLTAGGLKLLRYCELRERSEQEVVGQLAGRSGGRLGGVLRIAGYSSVMRSVILPVLSGLIRDNPELGFEFSFREMRELPGLLRRGEADLIVLDHELDGIALESHLLGHEHCVLVQSRRFESRVDVFLDHDFEDQVTDRFLKRSAEGASRASVGAQARNRAFLDDVYGLIDGVRLGLGRAVLPRHLIRDELAGERSELKIVGGSPPLLLPVYLHYYAQPYYTQLHEAAVRELTRGCGEILKRGR